MMSRESESSESSVLNDIEQVIISSMSMPASKAPRLNSVPEMSRCGMIVTRSGLSPISDTIAIRCETRPDNSHRFRGITFEATL